MEEGQRTRVTFLFERWRALAQGTLETAGTTFLLFLAVRVYEAGPTAKALVAGGGSVGLLMTPWVVSVVTRGGWAAARATGVLAGLGGACFLLMAGFDFLGVYVVGSVLAMAAYSGGIPLMTQVYQENYPEARRGQMFSKTVMIRIGAAALFSEAAGRLLTAELGWYRWLLVFFGAAYGFSAWCLWRVPSRALAAAESAHPFQALRFVRSDPLFRQTLVCWMLMGFGNLMMLPLRVEYLVDPRYGLVLSAGEIAFLLGVLPNAARLVMSPVWGWLFDRMNFFALRATLNLGFAVGILAFFTSDDVTGLILGAVVYGISNAGGDVAWGLWVTKFAPAERVADYMSVHTFFTGVRGVLAPLVAFHLVRTVSVGTIGWISAGMIVLSSLLLVREIPFGRRGRRVPALVEDVSE